MITGQTTLDPKLVEAFNEAYKKAIKLLGPFTNDREIEPGLLQDLTLENLMGITSLRLKVVSLFEDEFALMRIYRTVPSAIALVEFMTKAEKMSPVLEEATRDFKEQVLNELRLQIPKQVLEIFNLKFAMDECVPKNLTFNKIAQHEPRNIVGQFVLALVSKDIKANGSFLGDVALQDVKHLAFYPIYCRQFIEHEVSPHFDKDVRLSDREGRVVGNYISGIGKTLPVINIGIAKEDCKLSVNSILTLPNNSHAKILMELSSSNVAKKIKLSDKIRLVNHTHIRNLAGRVDLIA